MEPAFQRRLAQALLRTSVQMRGICRVPHRQGSWAAMERAANWLAADLRGRHLQARAFAGMRRWTEVQRASPRLRLLMTRWLVRTLEPGGTGAERAAREFSASVSAPA